MNRKDVFLAVVTAVVFYGVLASCGAYDVKSSDRLAGNKKDDAASVAGQIVVTFDDDVAEADIQETLAAVGGKVVERSRVAPRRFVLEVPEGEEDAYVAKYRAREEVVAADRNYVVKAFGY